KTCGFASPDGNHNPAAAADWMRVYFKHARTIHAAAKQYLEEVPAARSSLYQQFQRWRSRVSNEDSSVVNGRILLHQVTGPPEPRQMFDLMMRAFEFIARHGFKLASDTERRFEKALARISHVDLENAEVWGHLRQVLTLPYASQALRAMHALGLLKRIIPE